MTEAQGGELLDRVGLLLERVEVVEAWIGYLGLAAQWSFVALCCIVFAAFVTAVRR
jgi:hypothetical protein